VYCFPLLDMTSALANPLLHLPFDPVFRFVPFAIVCAWLFRTPPVTFCQHLRMTFLCPDFPSFSITPLAHKSPYRETRQILPIAFRSTIPPPANSRHHPLMKRHHVSSPVWYSRTPLEEFPSSTLPIEDFSSPHLSNFHRNLSQPVWARPLSSHWPPAHFSPNCRHMIIFLLSMIGWFSLSICNISRGLWFSNLMCSLFSSILFVPPRNPLPIMPGPPPLFRQEQITPLFFATSVDSDLSVSLFFCSFFFLLPMPEMFLLK